MKSGGLVESIRQRLMNLARANGEAFDFVLSRFGVERFLYRLSVSGEADRFVLKGATLFQVWNRRMHRPTRDLDLLGFGPDDLEAVRQSVLTIIRTAVPEDGLWFDEASLVVESTVERLAGALDYPVPAVDAYASLFFDVLDRKDEPAYIWMAARWGMRAGRWMCVPDAPDPAAAAILAVALNGTVEEAVAAVRSSRVT
jgi:hypothetical protein